MKLDYKGINLISVAYVKKQMHFKAAVSVSFYHLHVSVVLCVLSISLLAKQVIPPARCWVLPPGGGQSSRIRGALLGTRESQGIHEKACKVIKPL